MRRALAALVVALALAVGVPAPAGAAALCVDGPAGGSCTASPTAPDDDALAAARLVPQVARALRLRPDATLQARLESSVSGGTWTVWVQPRGGGPSLVTVELDASDLSLVSVAELPAGEWPPRLGEREAVAAAAADEEVIAEADELGGMDALLADARYVDGCCWKVTFALEDDPDGEVLLQADVADVTGGVTGVWTGHQLEWPMARGGRRAFGGDANVPWLWFSLAALFAIVVLDWRRLRSLATVDALALVAMLPAHEAWIAGDVALSTWLAAPPLAWLAARGAWMFVRGVPAAAAPRPDRRGRIPRLPRVPTALVLLVLVLLVGLRMGVVIEGGGVVDVGYAGVAGARLELAGETPYGNMPDDVGQGDTYGPLAYLAYVPAVAAIDDPDEHRFGGGEELPAAVATAVGADLLVLVALLLVGRRWFGRWRSGLLLALGWAACPWTIWAMASATNDALVALAMSLVLLAVSQPALRGALLMAGAAIKFAPLAALGVVAHVGSARRGRQSALVAAGAVAVLAACVGWLAFRGVTPIEFWDRTLGYQDGRDSPFTIWGLHGLEWLRRTLTVVVGVALLVAAARPRVRDARQIAAGLLAALAAGQLLAPHWFFFYLPWLVPPLLVVLLAQRSWGAVGAGAAATSGNQMAGAITSTETGAT